MQGEITAGTKTANRSSTTKPAPISTEAIEYTFTMVFISSPENFVISQKQASFAWEIIMDPEQQTMTLNGKARRAISKAC
jgi:hypothetical protein